MAKKMTLKQFKKIVEEALRNTGEFEIYDNKDIGFNEHLLENELVVVSEEDQPTFTITITKVD